MSSREDALAYHASGRPGKISVTPTKPLVTQRDLSLAYTPGVAEPCRVIAENPQAVDLYTARRNLVAVISDGTAVLGLGDIGPYAAKPVMEGKGVLFKKFADVDVFDIELAEKDPDKLVEIICALEPTFGGINLEDIKAPECFVIERKLRERLSIPVFHDDQHGTAIICAAALKNAVELQNKKMEELKVVCLGAGAAAVACMELWMRLGVKRELIFMADSKGIVVEGRSKLNEFKERFARPAHESQLTLEEALQGADVFLGLATGNLVTGSMIKRMAPRPIIMALANPDPEIPYEEARAARPDAIVATGRSDYPNQVNNVLGFPYIFRGALDVGARCISEEMKLAAALALADLARQDVPDRVRQAYGGGALSFGPDYIIPKPFDARVLYWVSPAVAQAAMDSGVARENLDIARYRERLLRSVSPTAELMWNVSEQVKKSPKRIVFCDGQDPRVLRAARVVKDEGIGIPVLLGPRDRIVAQAGDLRVNIEGLEIVDVAADPRLAEYAEQLHRLRADKGLSAADAADLVARDANYFGLMMLKLGHADVAVSGASQHFVQTLGPALAVVGAPRGARRALAVHLAIDSKGVRLLADTALNVDPDAETLAEIAVQAADAAQLLGIEPRVGMLGFATSFADSRDRKVGRSSKVLEATRLVRERRPNLQIEGELQADVALSEERQRAYPQSSLKGPANVLVFPNLDASHIGCKLIQALGAASGSTHVIGPWVLGTDKPVAILTPESGVEDIVHLTALAALRVGFRAPA
jgi:malate dehydrogenase (oxaloacetate-decarboxylating)(NADP+)